MANEEAKLFVAGLPDSISEDVLKQLFEATGGVVVQVSLPKDRATGRPRGFGFVTMGTPAEAQTARDSLDGSMQAGRSISVRPFQAEPPRRDAVTGAPTGGPRPMGPRPGMSPPPDSTLYVGNLPYDCSTQEVEELINTATASEGQVVRVHLPMDPDGRKRGFGFVTMSSADTAKAALEALKTGDLRGRRLVVNLAQPKGDRPPRTFGGPPGAGGYGGGGGGGYGGGGGGGSFAPPPASGRKTFDSDRRRGKPGGGPTEDGGGPRKTKKQQERVDRGGRTDDWEDE